MTIGAGSDNAQGLGSALAAESRGEESERFFNEAVQCYRQLVAWCPDEIRYKSELADAIRDQALLFAVRGDLVGAEQLLSQAATLVDEAARETPTDTNQLRALRSVYQALGHVQLMAGNPGFSRSSLKVGGDAVFKVSRLKPGDDLAQLHSGSTTLCWNHRSC